LLFTKEDKLLIVVLQQEKSCGMRNSSVFMNRNCSLSSLNKLLKKINDTMNEAAVLRNIFPMIYVTCS